MILEENKEGLLLKVYLQPKASKNEIIGPHEGALKIRVCAAPTEGQANEALCRFLAEALNISYRSVSLRKGTTSRHKIICLNGIDRKAVEQLLKIKP